ncbi:hypothetical protein TGPRC2_297465 [Toxoplasma gondii TgCatPRC2]|uniref:Uncharacterized protein n=7 Tax=Toxoplasma gondii TaxID=5811 RepID=V4YNV9_TOXGV|nr:hypothetical protein TGVEG_297465 [Toxoplasma gondii VEG]KFG29960.1 hypothetical protein TGP89_297465 [Toxoplasma gondii p89]KFG41930.1 hypothetical protein TGDOM2_297465 [Toxoplasma gondii GAB2-2007-GAL-DOM2]KFG61295.1 hypothetical protein TGRUB_297465 [Toxoplasma gondii RUB]KFH02991.1 hypothetical protein TGMAS_297465 [Toxoplasma gondii MAS]KYK63392.1 hypothetical protein TGPRC2_297465 [Toxoplasma gondii TgCatPRC2]PUA84718.1 hypothetical protein TGBR9_297465 [Toxoplasma gondii TgCATBr9]
MTTSVTSASSSSSFVFPPFFPLVRKGCEERATAFFACLGEATAPGDAGVTLENLEQCRSSCEAYETCTRKSLADPRAPLPTVFVDFQPPKKRAN